MANVTAESGRRGNWRYMYGTHAWVPDIDADWTKGIVRDAPRTAIPENALYDSADWLLHQPGFMQKRGGTSYAGPALTNAQICSAVAYADFPAGAKLIGIGAGGTASGHVFTVTNSTTTDLGGSIIIPVENPKLRVGGGKNLLVLLDGSNAPLVYDGSSAPTTLGGSPPHAKFSEVYKTRMVLGNVSGNENRLYFSPTPDITTTWDTTNSWIDCDHEVTGMASLHNALLIFSNGHVERIIGSTPPPGSDMDRSPLGDIGCTDARSIVVQEGNCLFANPRGVYLTNGAGFASLTTEGQIETYWQSLFSGYDPSTWTVAAGILRSFYFVSVSDNNRTNVATLMCNVPRRAWWRLSNVNARMFSQAAGVQDELYYAESNSPRVVKMAGIFTPSSSNKNDADGTAVTPTFTTRARSFSPSVKAFGDGHLTYDMRDASSDNPTLTVQIAKGAEATTFSSVAESPLGETTDATRQRFTTGVDSQAISVKVTQNNASSKTEIFSLEMDERPYPLAREGQ